MVTSKRPRRQPAPVEPRTEPRAKSLPPRDPSRERGREFEQALDRFAEASADFAAVVEDRSGCRAIDERYADLAHAAAVLLRASIDAERRALPTWFDPTLEALIVPHRRGEARPGEVPERDLEVASAIERAARKARRASS